jgi:hypothetical protein
MVPGNLKIAVLVCSCQIGDEVITCIPNGTKIVVLVNGWIDIQKKQAGNAEGDPERELENDEARNPNTQDYLGCTVVGDIHQVFTVPVGSI